MALTSSQVRHIAALARLTLSDAEVERFTVELSSILDYVSKLQEVDTSSVEASAQITGLSGVVRPDALIPSSCTTDMLLGTSPLPIVEQQIETPSAHGSP
ncbi:MAG: Asp-tRNA(Asn)/Glu-tRNA(Gln) amidotransferase subunit GatC [Candidatus Peregrinibacteria bacterium]